MDRPTKEVKTKLGHKVIYKEWITKGERLEIQRAASKGMEGVFDQETKQVVMKNIGQASVEAVALKAILNSVDDKIGDDMVNFVLNGMREEEANEIFEVVNKVTNPEEVKKK